MSVIKRPCAKCSGTGTIQAFAHIAGGACFDCQGRGFFVTTEANEEKRKATARRRAEKREAERELRYRTRLANLKAAGWTFEEVHDTGCACPDPTAADHATWRRDFEEA